MDHCIAVFSRASGLQDNFSFCYATQSRKNTSGASAAKNKLDNAHKSILQFRLADIAEGEKHRYLTFKYKEGHFYEIIDYIYKQDVQIHKSVIRLRGGVERERY